MAIDYEEQEKIIKEQYGGDEEAYFDAMFNIADISLETGIDPETIRNALIKNLPENDPRRIEIIANKDSTDLMTRLKYPGGRKAFMKDYKTGIYKGILHSPAETK